MIPIFWKEKVVIHNLPQLREKVREQGGAIIQYERIFSIVAFTRRYPVFEWVPSLANRKTAGLKHALFCGAAGWWSIMGLFATPVVIINNLMGGIDVTRSLAQPPPLPGEPPDPVQTAEFQRAHKRQQRVMLVYALILLSGSLLLGYYFFTHQQL